MLANIIRNSKKTALGGGGGGIVIDNGDPFYSAVPLLLPMDGSNGSTTFTDSGPNALTITAVGNTQISTTQSKYGGASGSFDGSGDYLSISDSSAPVLGSSDWTIEAWIYISVAKSFNCIYAKRPPGGYGFGLQVDGSNNLTISASTTGSSWALAGSSLGGGYTAGSWIHVAVVRSGNTITGYKNGVSTGTQTLSGTIWPSTGYAAAVASGLAGNTSQDFNGYIDDLRISLFARYVSTFTPPTAALPTTASSTPADPYYGYTSLLLHMDGTNASTNFVDSGPNALAVTASGSAQISTAQSKYGGASAYFDGSAGYLSPPASSGFSFGTGNVTIEAWVYPTATTGNFGIYATSAGGGPVAKFVVFLDSLSPNCHFYGLTNGNNIYTKATSTVAVNQWSHIAFVRSGTTWTWYINGVASGSGTNSTAITFSTEPTYIGYGGQAFFNYFSGHIDDLRVTKYARYTSAFTPPAQAHLEYANGNDRHFSNVSLLLHMDGANGSTTFTDNSSNARTITAVGNTQISTTQSKFGGASAYFDGSGDYLSFTGGMPSGSGTAFTIECWIRLDDLSSYRAITRTAGGLDIGVQPNGLINCDQTSVGIIANSATGVITAGTWYHIAVTRDTSNNYKIYVNGTQVASGTNSFSVTAATTIGFSAYSGAHYFKGYIDDFRATNVLRYTSNFTPPTQAHPNA